MYDMEITMLEYVLIQLDKVAKDEIFQFKSEFITFLFTSQGIENVSYLDFEAEFPELAHNMPALVAALESPTYQGKIGRVFRSRINPEQEMDRSTRLLSDEFDGDDYEASQQIPDFPFHM
jgi:hypothetical protein